MLSEFVFPMKAAEIEGDVRVQLARLEEGGGYWAEAKLDGHRVQVIVRDGQLVDFTHNGGGSYAGRFPDVVPHLARALPTTGLWVVDGEVGLLVDEHRMDFRAVQSRAMMNDEFKIGLNARRSPMSFVAFDLLVADGRDMTAHPYETRRAALERSLTANERVRLVSATPRLLEHYDHVCGLGGEGIMVKLQSAAYARGKRSKAWLKAKAPRFLDNLQVVGLLAGTGERSTSFGSLVLARRAGDGGLDYVCKVGTGLRDADLVRIVDHVQARRIEACPLRSKPPPFDRELLMWVEPCLRVEVEFDPPIPAQDGKPRVPRHPRVKNIHYD